MIRALVDFALNNKFVVLAIAVFLLGWGAISFHAPNPFLACRS